MIEDIEVTAARLEAEQAQRDYSEAFKAFQAATLRDERTYGTALDYAVWSTAGYADSALRAIPRKRKTPAPGLSQYIRMTDGIKGKRTPPRRLIAKGRSRP